MKTRALLAWSAGIATASALLRSGINYRVWKIEQVERLRTESQQLETPHGPIEYQMQGEGPVVMIIHGSPGGYDQGIALANLIGLDGYTTLAVSRPGYRRTPLSSGETPEAQADLFADCLSLLNVPQAIVIALSGGGPSALQFALRHPEHCQALIMLSALCQNYTEEGTYRALPLGQRQIKKAFDRLIVYDPFLYLMDGLTRRLPDGAKASAFIHSLVMNDPQTIGYQNDMQQFADLPRYPIQDITTPTLVVHGTNDLDLPFHQAQQLAQKIPHARLVAVEGANHFSTVGSEMAASEIHAFLQKVI